MVADARLLPGGTLHHVTVKAVSATVQVMSAFFVDFAAMVCTAAVTVVVSVMPFAGPLSLLRFFNGMIFVSSTAGDNLGRPFYATPVNWGRHRLGTIPSCWSLRGGGVRIGQSLDGVVFGAPGSGRFSNYFNCVLK